MDRKSGTGRRIALGGGLLNLVLLLIGFSGILIASLQLETGVWVILLALVAGDAVYSVLAVLILLRHPRHRIGWLFLVIGFIYAVAVFDGLMYALALTLPIHSEPMRGLIVLTFELALTIVLTLPVSLVLLYFPDGRLPSPRWWPIAAATLIGLFGSLGFTLLSPFSPDLQAELNAGNPLASEAIAGVWDSVGLLFNALYTIGFLGAINSLVLRYRRTRGTERTQMKWLVYTAVISIMFLSVFGELIDSSPFSVYLFFWPVLLAGAIGIAILRHQLFDIDIIIRRTLSYALLSAMLGLIYFGGVVLLQGVFGSLLGTTDSSLIIVISTLTIAALFTPLRLHTQAFIDRRFFRQKYDAERSLAAFAATARDEVDVERLAGALLDMAEETIQPEGTSLWLKM